MSSKGGSHELLADVGGSFHNTRWIFTIDLISTIYLGLHLCRIFMLKSHLHWVFHTKQYFVIFCQS